ncbi:hypothetical protein [Parasedimentitalea psychrophila]|uniref:HTH rpiR-type domain-containing protein n=1 Tax=Parasedimentitalea psychrophila TaxID=2997337 RepID=A0A9Y2L0I2_9RHOB|nr:hypothetical protein [Parasedimentitalea psychrophila]WIY25809.1 hypothetical protein QPJ95_02400 [Parasedimentitalea psychrophila]
MSKNNIAQRIQEDRGSLTRAFRKIADFLVAEPQQFISNPIRILSESIGVSEPTIIRFARHYEFQGLPDLRLAFAMSTAAADSNLSAHLEPRLKDKEVVNREAKQAIASRAVELTTSDNSLLLDSGSTAQFLTEQLVDAPAKTIMTTSLNSVLILRNSNQHRLIMSGGTLRPDAMSLAGRMAETNLSDMAFDTAYLGVDIINPERGLSTFSEEESHLNRAMIRASKRVVVMVDSSKFVGPALHNICDLSAVDIIISDTSLPADICSAIKGRGVDLILVDVPSY